MLQGRSPTDAPADAWLRDLWAGTVVFYAFGQHGTPDQARSCSRFLYTRSVSALSRRCPTLHFLITPFLDTIFTEGATAIIVWAGGRNHCRFLSRALSVYGTKLRGNTTGHAQAQMVRQLLGKEPVDPKATNLMPLLNAVNKGDKEVAKVLLKAGADVHMADGGLVVMTPVNVG